MLTSTFAYNEWSVIDLHRVEDDWAGSGWEAELESVEGHGILCHLLDGDDQWIMHFFAGPTGMPEWSHGFGSVGVIARVLPDEGASLLDMVLAAGYQPGDDIAEWQPARLIPLVLEKHGQMRLNLNADLEV
jgi:hypothetical protein